MESENINESNNYNSQKKFQPLEKITVDKLKGRVIIFNPEQSEFAKNLDLRKRGDYSQKQK